MFDEYLRALKDRLLAPVARRVRLGPAAISLLALAVGIAAAALAADGRFGAALAAWIVNRVLDGLDGAVARAQGTQSDLGGYLDIMADFVVYALLPIGIAAADPTSDRFRAVLVLLATFYVNAASWMYLAAILERRKAAGRALTAVAMPPGLVAGTETIVFFAAFLLWPAHLVPLALAMAALVLVGALQRIVWAARHL